MTKLIKYKEFVSKTFAVRIRIATRTFSRRVLEAQMSRASETYKPPSNMHNHQRTLKSNPSLELKENVSNATSFMAQLSLTWLAQEREDSTVTGKKVYNQAFVLRVLVPGMSWQKILIRYDQSVLVLTVLVTLSMNSLYL